MHLYPEVKVTNFPEIQRISTLFREGRRWRKDVKLPPILGLFFFLHLLSTMEYIVLFSHMKAAVYYTKTKVHVLNHVPLAKLDICRPWAQQYHFVPWVIDHGHKANQAVCRLSRTHSIAGQLSWLVLSRNSYWINEFKLSTFYFKI